MSRFEFLFQELLGLQSELQSSSDHLWAIKLKLASLEAMTSGEEDFLLRRLRSRLKDVESRFVEQIERLNHLVSIHLDGAFLILSSTEDVETIAKIRKTIRYIRNSFAGDSALGEAWARLNLALPSYSQN